MCNTNELQFLQKLHRTLVDAKQELKNDLTRLAVKKMPLMIENSTASLRNDPDDSIVVDPNSNLAELEPLDLDIQ